MEIIDGGGSTILDQVLLYMLLALVVTVFFRLLLFRDGDSADMIGSGFAGLIWPISLLVLVFALLIILLAVFAEWIIGIGKWMFFID